MMDQEILTTILKNTFSLTQFNSRVKLLKSNLLKIFFGGNGDGNLPAMQAEWLKSLPESFYQKFNKDNVYNIFSALEKMGAKLPILTIYLTFEPDDVTLSQLGLFSRKTFGFLTLLLDIKIDPKLAAGCALVWKGVYRDYSLHAKIEEKRNEISQEFKKFLR